MTDLNRVTLIGRMVKEPELKKIPSGTSVTTFSIANNRTQGSGDSKKDEVSFFNCVAWGKLAEIISQYGTKGKQIAIDARLQQRSWSDKEGKKQYTNELVINDFQFLGDKKDAKQSREETPHYNAIPETPPFDDKDVPF